MEVLVCFVRGFGALQVFAPLVVSQACVQDSGLAASGCDVNTVNSGIGETGRARCLTVAGSDCSGGAGIQADLKVFHRFGVFGQSAVTAIVAENTVGVQGYDAVTPGLVAMQIDSCLSDIGADAVKTGMLVNVGIVAAVAERLRFHGARNLVIDPVMCAKNGDRLIAEDAVAALVADLFPLATVVTPNVPEAEALWGRRIETADDFRQAAAAIRAMGPRVVVMKGGHSPVNPPGESVDFVLSGNDWTAVSGPRGSDRNTHGTGCTFSAAVTARLALGDDPVTAVRAAKAYITAAIATAPDLGHGHGPVNHWADV